MATKELKADLIKKIQDTKEDYILEEVSRLLAFEEEVGEIYNVNDEQRRLLNKSMKEVEDGEYLTDEEVQKETKEWLKK